MVYISYLFSELSRRRGRTFLTALGLAVGVGLVITVSALSAGLDQAQAKVLRPLTGVGTDLSVTRPIVVSSSNRGFQGLSDGERQQLQKENGGRRLDFSKLTPGTKFTDTSFGSSQLSFTASKVKSIASLDGVESAAGGLTVNLTTISGTVPEQTQTPQGGFRAGPPSGPGSLRGNAGLNSTTVSGVDQTKPQLGAITSGQISKGSYFSSGSAREAILNVSYARSKGLKVGDTIKLDGKKFAVVGIVKTPLGGQASDVYVKLAQLQKLSDRVGRVNTVYVRATNASKVDAVANAITASFSGASVTTAKSLADQVSGSLMSAKNLTSKLGFAFEVVALLGAVLIASLLTLSSVTKRVRELGTLKALGWPQRVVVRQVTAEALLQGVLGGMLGIVVGLAGAAIVGAVAPTLKATVAAAAQTGFPGQFGQGAVTAAGTQTVSLTAPVSAGLIALAVVLAVAGGLLSGAVGGFRASRLRPADALRHID